MNAPLLRLAVGSVFPARQQTSLTSTPQASSEPLVPRRLTVLRFFPRGTVCRSRDPVHGPDRSLEKRARTPTSDARSIRFRAHPRAVRRHRRFLALRPTMGTVHPRSIPLRLSANEGRSHETSALPFFGDIRQIRPQARIEPDFLGREYPQHGARIGCASSPIRSQWQHQKRLRPVGVKEQPTVRRQSRRRATPFERLVVLGLSQSEFARF